jgi:DNA-binding protein H-NS
MPPDEPEPEQVRSSENSQESEYTEEHYIEEPIAPEQFEEPSEVQGTENSVPSEHLEEPTQSQEENMALEPVSGEEFDNYLDALDRLSMEQLIVVINTAQHLRAEKQNEVRAQLVAEFRERAQAMGMSLDSIFPTMVSRRSSGDKPPLENKYRGPNGEGWTGRGMPPRWLQARIDTGEPKADFFIQADGKTQWEKTQQEAAA